jgi:hypothetical protein
MRLMQALDPAGNRGIVVTTEGESWWLEGHRSIYDLALAAAESDVQITELVNGGKRGGAADPAGLLSARKVLPPIDHPDPAHVIVSGTGLTHLGSAAARDAMHKKMSPASEDELVTDSMRMFRMGVEGGKPGTGVTGVQPEWFYKGDGSGIATPGGELRSPSFADDAGEEPEVAGIYVIDRDGTPLRIGYALCNELSDHLMERQNYLWLAHSKLRPCGLGPELLLGDLPENVEGISRIRRRGQVIFEKEFHTGEANMTHSIANLEAHHFKYPMFRRPGDVHIHSFGTGTASFADGIRTEAGDVFEIEAPLFGLPLVNTLAVTDMTGAEVRKL